MVIIMVGIILVVMGVLRFGLLIKYILKIIIIGFMVGIVIILMFI